MRHSIRLLLVGVLLWLGALGCALAASQAPVGPGMLQFSDGNGAPFAGGKVYMYEPGTTTPKATFKDANGLVQNTNPTILDANGRGIFWGTGSYRQVLQDALGNTQWDQAVLAPSGAGGVGGAVGSTFCASTNTTGSANAQIISPNPAISALVIGNIYCAIAGFSNPGAMTLEVSATGFHNVMKQSAGGLGVLQGGEITVGQGYLFQWDGAEFQLLNAQAIVGLEVSILSYLPAGQPDGVTDNSVSVRNMVTALCGAAKPGNKVYMPPGKYVIHDVNIPCGISFRGSGPAQNGGTTIDYTGSTLYSLAWTPAGWPAVTHQNKIYGVSVEGINFYSGNPAKMSGVGKIKLEPNDAR